MGRGDRIAVARKCLRDTEMGFAGQLLVIPRNRRLRRIFYGARAALHPPSLKTNTCSKEKTLFSYFYFYKLCPITKRHMKFTTVPSNLCTSVQNDKAILVFLTKFLYFFCKSGLLFYLIRDEKES